MSTPQILPAVVSQQQKPREIAWRPVPPLHLPPWDEHHNPEYQGNGADISTSEWDLDENTDVTPIYVQFVLEELEIPSSVSVTEDNNGDLMIEIPPNNPFSQPIQRRPFGYEPFSDPDFPSNFLPYTEESLVEDNLISEGRYPAQSRDSAMVALAFVARVSVADSETEVFPSSLDYPINIDLPVGLGDPLRDIDLLISEDIDWEV